MPHLRALRSIINTLRAAEPDAHRLAGGATAHGNPPASFVTHPDASSSRVGPADGAMLPPAPSAPTPEAALMLKEAFRAAGWEASMAALLT